MSSRAGLAGGVKKHKAIESCRIRDSTEGGVKTAARVER